MGSHPPRSVARRADGPPVPSPLSRRRLLQASAATAGTLAVGHRGARPRRASAQAAVELSFWSEYSSDPELGVMNGLIEQFQEANPNVSIEHRPIENEQFFTVMRTGFTGGDPPDLFQHEGYQNLFQFSDLGEVADISDFWEANAARFVPATVPSIQKGDTFFGIPWSIHTGTQIYYNPTVLADNAIDPAALVTWDDYLSAFETLKGNGVTPISMGNKAGWPACQWLWAFFVRQAGVGPMLELIARQNGRKWTDPDTVQAAQFLADLNDRGYLPAGKVSDDYPASTALFFGGRAGFMQTGSWLLSDVGASAPPDFELGINVFPTLPAGHGDPNQIVMHPLDGLAISRQGAEDAAKREAALAFFDFLTQPAAAGEWVSQAARISPIVGAVSPETADASVMKIWTEQVEGNSGALPFPDLILPKTVGEEKLWMGGIGLLTGELTAESFMQSVEDEAAKLPPVFTYDG